MICESCNQERRELTNGVCIICLRAGLGTKQVMNLKIQDNHGKEVLSKTGKKDENIYLRG